MGETTTDAAIGRVAGSRAGVPSQPRVRGIRGMGRRHLALAVLLCGLALSAACGGSDDNGERAASEAAPAASTSEPATAAEPTTSQPEPEQEATRPGDPAIGLQVFTRSCEGCHADAGNASGYGPRLAGQGLTEPQIQTTVTKGPGQMPAGLVSGQELADVAAYVASLQ